METMWPIDGNSAAHWWKQCGPLMETVWSIVENSVVHRWKQCGPLMETVWSTDGNGVAHWWHPSTMNGPIAKFNKICFSEQFSMSYIHEIWFQYIEQSRIFKSVFFSCLYAIYSFIFVNNIKMGQRGQTYPTSERHCFMYVLRIHYDWGLYLSATLFNTSIP
jgi:hypothetical protein